MAMGRRRTVVQGEFWIATDTLRKAPGHPFYERLNQVLDEAGFDARIQRLPLDADDEDAAPYRVFVGIKR